MSQSGRQPAAANPPGRKWIALVILGVPAIGLTLLVIYSEQIMEVLRQRFPPGAVPQAAIFFGLAGIVVSGITISNLREAAAARRWPVARGRVIRSEVEKKWLSSGATHGSHVHGYLPLVEYQYTVEGQIYHSCRVRLGATVTAEEEAAKAEAAKLPVGADVQVHYDPHHPQNAVLEAVVAFKPWTFLIAIVFLALAIYFSAVF